MTERLGRLAGLRHSQGIRNTVDDRVYRPSTKALPLDAVLFVTAGLAVFAIGDAIAKLLVQDLPAVQVNWGRFAFMVPC